MKLAMIKAICLLFLFLPLIIISTADPGLSQDHAAGKKSMTDNLATATFAGGCFWCVESDFEKAPRRGGSYFRLYRGPGRKSHL